MVFYFFVVAAVVSVVVIVVAAVVLKALQLKQILIFSDSQHIVLLKWMLWV